MSRTELPPHNLTAEQAVLGSLLRDNAALDEVAGLLRAEDFYRAAHQVLYRTILELGQSGRPVDLVTLAEHLHRKGQLPEIGGAAYLADCYESAPTAINAAHYARIVRDHATLRALLRAGHEVVARASQPTGGAEETLAEAERLVLAVRDERTQAAEEERHVAEVIEEVETRLAQRAAGQIEAGLPTLLPSLDYLLGGLRRSEFIVVAARPSVGKTTLALAFALAALQQQRAVLFVSLEQPRRELIERALCAQAGVDSQAVQQGQMTAEETARFRRAERDLRATPWYLCDQPRQTVQSITARARRLLRRKQLDLLVVDYLQLLEPESRKEPRHEQVATMSRRLKLLARELNVPVVVAAQLNRESEHRVGQKPRLSDLRESGAIEADADVVLLLHRPDRDLDDLGVEVAKHRNGPTGEVLLLHERRTGRIRDALRGHPF